MTGLTTLFINRMGLRLKTASADTGGASVCPPLPLVNAVPAYTPCGSHVTMNTTLVMNNMRVVFRCRDCPFRLPSLRLVSPSSLARRPRSPSSVDAAQATVAYFKPKRSSSGYIQTWVLCPNHNSHRVALECSCTAISTVDDVLNCWCWCWCYWCCQRQWCWPCSRVFGHTGYLCRWSSHVYNYTHTHWPREWFISTLTADLLKLCSTIYEGRNSYMQNSISWLCRVENW